MAKRIPVTQTVTRFFTNAMVKNEAKFSLVQKYYAHGVLAGAFETSVPEFQFRLLYMTMTVILISDYSCFSAEISV